MAVVTCNACGHRFSGETMREARKKAKEHSKKENQLFFYFLSYLQPNLLIDKQYRACWQ